MNSAPGVERSVAVYAGLAVQAGDVELDESCASMIVVPLGQAA